MLNFMLTYTERENMLWHLHGLFGESAFHAGRCVLAPDRSVIWTHRKNQLEVGHCSFVTSANEAAAFLYTEMLLSATLIL